MRGAARLTPEARQRNEVADGVQGVIPSRADGEGPHGPPLPRYIKRIRWLMRSPSGVTQFASVRSLAVCAARDDKKNGGCSLKGRNRRMFSRIN